ncbi:MAG: type I DNA topoisomerase [Clostridia bacterium]|nr:type I DNA topoisomerase [Clostridia bacterium]
MSNLVIVESPSKAGTIKGYLGSNYKVVASKGHIRDLPKSSLGVDIENGFEPKYINIRGKGDLIKDLKKEVKSAKKVFLATDPDREGEAISWHLMKALGLDENSACRITFNEISKPALREAIAHPTAVDMNLVDSQQARRILDRIVGYKISPLLWKRIRGGLSAGRVQSVATRLVVDREREIEAFVKEEFWTLDALLATESKKPLTARFFGEGEKKLEMKTEKDCDAILKKLKGAEYVVSSVKKSVKTKKPAPPFTTAQLQQEAYRKLNFQSGRTMRVAQSLYEGVSLGKKGEHGLITYMRTDSLRVSDQAQSAARDFIAARYGADFVPAKPWVYRAKGGAQDAHEAIRPTDVTRTPESVKESLTSDQYRLYRLIWNRFVASQMSSTVIDAQNVVINAGALSFRCSGETVRFTGHLAVYEQSADETEKTDDALNAKLPPLTEGEKLSLTELLPHRNFTQPPARYTEATLIKTLDEKGIGRPSTFSPTVTTILERGYIARKDKQLVPTPLGTVTNDLMENDFAPIIDYRFTAQLEEKLDEVAKGKMDYKKVLGDFYDKLASLLGKAQEQGDEKVRVPDIETDIVCPKCGRKMVVRTGRFGKFAACPGYPQCRSTVPLDKEGNAVVKSEPEVVEGMKCELCGGPVVKKKGRFGDFYACKNYPACRYTRPVIGDTGVACPKCGAKIVKKWGKKKEFYSCERYPECDWSSWDAPTTEKCPGCGGMLLKKKSGRTYCPDKNCSYSITKKESAGSK